MLIFQPLPRNPTWLQTLGPIRSHPMAYLTRYRSGMPSVGLGDRSSACPFCKVLHFSSERVKGPSLRTPRFQTCCKEGQVELESIPEPPAALRQFWTSQEAHCKRIRFNDRHYNNAFAFKFFNSSPDRRLAKARVRGGARNFSVHGEVYHQIGLLARPGVAPRYAQPYYFDPNQANEERVWQGGSEECIVGELSAITTGCDPFGSRWLYSIWSLSAWL